MVLFQKMKEEEQMIHKLSELDAFLEKRTKQLGMNFGLERIEALLEGLNVSHEELPIIHVAGTNGKGSTIAFLRNILMEQGYTVGTFTSPHIESIQEVITLNESYISEADFIRLFNKVIAYVEIMEEDNLFPTQFEILTIIAFMYFLEKQPDIVLLETGLGGRLDSTNVVTPLLSIITSISRDHTNILGSEISNIALEKAGIIKEGKPVVTGVKNEEALSVIQKVSGEKGSPLFILNQEFSTFNEKGEAGTECFSYEFGGEHLGDMAIRMLGKHQIENAALAVTAILILKKKYAFTITETSIKKGLLQTFWKGRIEVVHTNPTIIIDGSHNEEGIAALVATLKSHYSSKKIIFLTAALVDKDVASMVSQLELIGHTIICTEFKMNRAMSAKQLGSYCRHSSHIVVPEWQSAIVKGMELIDEDSILVITGSLYFLANVRPLLLKSLKNN